jgi:hypothetical protein
MLKLIAYSQKRSIDLKSELEDEKNRKKSHNMIFAIAVANDILDQIKPIPQLTGVSFDIIFCTGEGDIIQTFEFYKNITNAERARPLVFQNSLHSSTLGALSLAISPVSSGTTISNGDLSFEIALDMALASPSSNPLIIVGTDVYTEQTLKIRKRSYENNVELVSGACAGLFIPEHSPLFKILNGPVISDIKFQPRAYTHEDTFADYYPANGLENIYEGLKNSFSFSVNRPNNIQINISAHEN